MSDAKRPQNKDISDLKARLGLKKGAEAAPAPKTASASAGVVPAPPGAMPAPVPPGGTVPPPPGMAAPTPAAAPMPNAADDPFGAMNAMAQRQAVAPRPADIVIVNDGKAVEDVSAGKSAAKYAKFVGIGLVPLVVGVWIGQIGKDAAVYNSGIKAAGDIAGFVKTTKKSVADVERDLEEKAKKANFRASKELTAELDKLSSKLDLNNEVIFKYKQNALDSNVSGRALAFFAGVSELQQMLKGHVDAAKMDDLALATAAKKGDAGKLAPNENAPLAGTFRYGVLVTNPSAEEQKSDGGQLGAQIVELGRPYCGNGNMSSDGTCADGVTGFAYRGNPGSGWTKGSIAQAGPGEKIAHKSLLVALPNETLGGLVKGGEPSASEALYKKRLEALLKRSHELVEEGNKIEADLVKASKKSKRFTFFL